METATSHPTLLTSIHDCVRAELEQTNRFILEQLHCDIPLVQEVGQHLINTGGKRVRPLLVLLASQAMNYQGEDHIKLATIFEFIHTATLFHDDVVDNSNLRRGKLTAHKIWGNPTSVLVGDFLYSRALQLTSQLDHSKITRILGDTTNQLAQGEILQLLNTNNLDLSIDDYLETIRRKTAYLFGAAAQSAAILSGANNTQEQALYQYGLNLGIAFQLADDLLDYRGNQEVLGKNIGQDLSEGKLTLPFIVALKNATPEESRTLREALLNKKTELSADVLKIISSTGAFDFTEKIAKQYADLSVESLEAVPASDYRTALAKLAQFSQSRSH